MVGSLSALVSRNVTTTLTGMSSVIGNDATVDTFVVDNRSVALTANTAVQTSLAGRRTTVSVAYAFQRMSDANPITRIPRVIVHNVSTSLQVALSSTVSVAPTLSYAATSTRGAEGQRNLLLGFRGQGRWGNLRPSLNISQTYSGGRAVSMVQGQVTYALPWETRFSVQGRHGRYAAIGNRPAFQESFLTMSVARSF